MYESGISVAHYIVYCDDCLRRNRMLTVLYVLSFCYVLYSVFMVAITLIVSSWISRSSIMAARPFCIFHWDFLHGSITSFYHHCHPLGLSNEEKHILPISQIFIGVSILIFLWSISVSDVRMSIHDVIIISVVNRLSRAYMYDMHMMSSHDFIASWRHNEDDALLSSYGVWYWTNELGLHSWEFLDYHNETHCSITSSYEQ